MFPIYLVMASFGCVVYVHIHEEGFPGFGVGEDAGHALPCSQPQVWHASRWVLLRWNFFGLKCTLKVNIATPSWSAVASKSPFCFQKMWLKQNCIHIWLRNECTAFSRLRGHGRVGSSRKQTFGNLLWAPYRWLSLKCSSAPWSAFPCQRCPACIHYTFF